MTTHLCNAGEAIHHHPDGHLRRFRPRGKLRLHHEGAIENPSTRLGGGGYSARLFVGLNVGQAKRYNENDIVDLVWRTRKRQGRSADASILSQKGIYEDRSGARVVEPSVQVLILDFSGQPKKAFTAEMIQLGEVLAKRLRQEIVIVEIQKKGVVTDVFSVTR
jgi:hypothetical protein